ncbi:hypothetical protein DV737_g4068, partial [Chaetothyriales sp. CBS 132003]
MLRYLLVFCLACFSTRTSQVQFSVNNDVFAFPQYDIIYSESYIPFDVAAGRIQRQSRRKQSVAELGDDSPDLSPHLNGGDFANEDEDGQVSEYAVLQKHGRPYFCTIPVNKPSTAGQAEEILSEADRQAELARAEHNGRELLQGMEGNQCLFYTTGWWTYSFCYKAQVRQFHALSPGAAGGRVWPPQEDPTTPSYVLGKFDSKLPQGSSSESSNTDVTELQSKAETNYLVQRLHGGTKCDLTGMNRQVEVWEARKSEEASRKMIEQEISIPILIGDVEVGAMKHVGQDGKRIERGRVVLAQEERAEIIVMQKDGKVSSMSKADLKKRKLDAEVIEMFREELEKVAGDKDWKIEKLDDVDGQIQLRGVISVDDDDDSATGTDEKSDGDPEGVGSEEEYKEEI